VKGEQCMNYIYFNDRGRLQSYHIDDLYQGSNLSDKLYVFADFDLEDETPYTLALMFRRKDGIEIGEVEGIRELNVINPKTQTAMPAFTYLVGHDVLNCAGELQISARYYYHYDIDNDGTLDHVIKGTAMIVATVNEAVPTNNAQSTVFLNINRKIKALQDSLAGHDHDEEYYTKTEIDAHKHNDDYFTKNESNSRYGVSIEIDQNKNLVLKNALGEILSTVFIPDEPGTPVFFGAGTFIMDTNKNYVVVPIGSPTIHLDVYKAAQSGETGDIVYTKLTNGLENDIEQLDLTQSIVFKVVPNETTAHDPFDGTYCISGYVYGDGRQMLYETGYLDFGMINSDCWPAYGFNSIGYYKVYELGL